ncbi:MAG: hypothetical protein OSB43_08425 [Nocardioides sp.]|uniref:hypothetical protein n=1 Tax=Nocardioides sp. TaxID=35761 RepID=UPI00239C07D2|nr:hypothetical protein [Nocardioides sp.]MDE0776284.1 hypothetical protein [Nocardioides sp.]
MAANTNAAAFPVLIVVFVPSHVLISLQLIGIEGTQRECRHGAVRAVDITRPVIPSTALLASIHSGLSPPPGRRLNLEP